MSNSSNTSRTANFAKSAVASYARFAVVMGTQFALTPIILHAVGATDFGLWSLTVSLMGFLGLLDGGLATSLVKYIAECRGRADEIERKSRLASTLGALYLLLALAATVVTGILTPLYAPLFHLPVEQTGTAQSLLWLLSLRFVVLALPLSLFYGILFGEQKMPVINGIQAVSTVFYAVSVWIALRMGGGIVAVAWVNLAAMLLEYGTYTVLSFRVVPGLRLSATLVDWKLAREVGGFAGAQLLVNVAALIRMRTDPIIVKMFLPLSAVGTYAVALRIAEAALLLTKQVINLLAPFVAQLRTANDPVKLRFVLFNAAKFVFAAATLLTVGVCALARPLLDLWVGPEMGEAATPTLIILMISMCLVVPQMVAASVLVMTGHHKMSARAQVVGMLVNVVVSLLLARPLGLAGVALGTLVATIAVDVLYVLPRACTLHDATFGRYLRQVFLPSLVCGGVQAGVTLGIYGGLRFAAGLPAAIALPVAALPGVLIFAALFWGIFVEQGEKTLLREKLLRRGGSRRGAGTPSATESLPISSPAAAPAASTAVAPKEA